MKEEPLYHYDIMAVIQSEIDDCYLEGKYDTIVTRKRWWLKHSHEEE